ncbi:MAG TPA: carboxypeptidase-like regulatory domain-containing protein, partial [Pyrinomonadaceae bacterium]|nr:carboxypeptidase-like regulatory domain-containing protein [Pyrinomonadaceae bacterium]
MKRYKREPRFARALFAFAVCCFAFVGVAHAQNNKATITGTVKDPNGAVVKDAQVVVTNTATGETREASTSDDGAYSVPALDPGQYRVEITAAGFAPFRIEVQLETNARQPVDADLSVAGTPVETLTVTAEAPLVESETSVRGDLITGRQVTELPIPQRNFTLLAGLSPGVTRPAVGGLGGGGNF